MKRIRVTHVHPLPDLVIDAPPSSEFTLPTQEMPLRDRLLSLLHHLNTQPKSTLPLMQSLDYVPLLLDLYHPELECQEKSMLFRCLTKVFGSALEPAFLASLENVIPLVIECVMEEL